MQLPFAPPPPIRTDHSNAFANNTMRARLPAIVDETVALNPDYPASIKGRLVELRDNIAAGAPVPPLEIESAADYRAWCEAWRRQRDINEGVVTWQGAEWFYAETFAYRCLIEAVRWVESGRDPFLPKKLEELRSEALWRLLDGALEPTRHGEEALMRAVAFDLWANRIDLSYAASTMRGTAIDADDLLVDDREALLAHIADSAAGGSSPGNSAAHIVVDNAGSELAMDLALSDCLLRRGVERVILHLKAHPTFVSDATRADVWLMLEAMERRGGRPKGLAQRLRDSWCQGRLRFLPHLYWNSSRFLWQLPGSFQREFADALLVVIKGDANYRRAVGDCLWPAHTPFADVLRYLEAPVLCLRTLKSDPVIGLPSADVAPQLDRADPEWRVNGKRGLIQFKPRASAGRSQQST